jgi:hypothetical protein
MQTKAFAFVTQDCLLRTSPQGQIQLGHVNQADETASPLLASHAIAEKMQQSRCPVAHRHFLGWGNFSMHRAQADFFNTNTYWKAYLVSGSLQNRL